MEGVRERREGGRGGRQRGGKGVGYSVERKRQEKDVSRQGLARRNLRLGGEPGRSGVAVVEEETAKRTLQQPLHRGVTR